jgi:hypothetical protein
LKQHVIEAKDERHNVSLRPGTYLICFDTCEKQEQRRWHFVEGDTIRLEIEPGCKVLIESLHER